MGDRRQVLAGDVEGASVAAALARRYLLPFASQHVAGILLQLLWHNGRLVVLLELLARRTTLCTMHPLQFGDGATAVGVAFVVATHFALASINAATFSVVYMG